MSKECQKDVEEASKLLEVSINVKNTPQCNFICTRILATTNGMSKGCQNTIKIVKNVKKCQKCLKKFKTMQKCFSDGF